MSEQFEMIVPSATLWSPNKLAIVHTATQVPVNAAAVYIAIQSNVDLTRQTEIIEGLRRLVNYASDNKVMSDTTFPAAAYVRMPVGGSESDMVVEGDIANVTPDDLVIGIGGTLRGEPVGSDSLNVMLESAFTMLRDYALENFLKLQRIPIAYVVPGGAITVITGTYVSAATLTLTGEGVWERGTLIDITGTTGAGAFTLNVVTPRDMVLQEVALLLAEFLKGWDQATFKNVRHPSNSNEVSIGMLAFAGGAAVSFDSYTITPVP